MKLTKTFCTFITNKGMKKDIVFDSNRTISELIKKYFNKIGKPELFTKPNLINFQFNGKTIDFNSQDKVENLFLNFTNVIIYVYDYYNLIDNNFIENNSIEIFNINFKFCTGKEIIISIEKGKTVKDLIRAFFNKIGKPKLFKSKDINFLCNGNRININSKKKIENFFNSLPKIILVMDSKNLLAESKNNSC